MVNTLTPAFAARLDAEHLAVLQSRPGPPLDLSDVPAARKRRAAEAALLPTPPIPAGVTTEDRLVPNAAAATPDAPGVTVRLYRPATLPSGAPALYYIHGGGMVLGDVAMSDPYCAGLADRLNILVASVEYRLAPEHPYPAPLDDCYAGLAWLAAAAPELGIDRRRIAIGGGSAGGGLAAGLALLVRDRGEIDVCFQLLVFPMLDDRNQTPSSYAITEPFVWDRTKNLAGWNAYLDGRAGADDVSPYAAPARASDLAGLPPAYISVGTLDLFLDEDIAYAQALLAAQVPVELHVYPGAFHGSPMLVPDAPISKRWRDDELAALDEALHGPAPR